MTDDVKTLEEETEAFKEEESQHSHHDNKDTLNKDSLIDYLEKNLDNQEKKIAKL